MGRHDSPLGMILRVEVKHEIRERPLEARAGPKTRGESRAGDRGVPEEVEYAEPLAMIGVGCELEVERGRIAPPPDGFIVLLAFAAGDRYVRRYWQAPAAAARDHVPVFRRQRRA